MPTVTDVRLDEECATDTATVRKQLTSKLLVARARARANTAKYERELTAAKVAEADAAAHLDAVRKARVAVEQRAAASALMSDRSIGSLELCLRRTVSPKIAAARVEVKRLFDQLHDIRDASLRAAIARCVPAARDRLTGLELEDLTETELSAELDALVAAVADGTLVREPQLFKPPAALAVYEQEVKSQLQELHEGANYANWSAARAEYAGRVSIALNDALRLIYEAFGEQLTGTALDARIAQIKAGVTVATAKK